MARPSLTPPPSLTRSSPPGSKRNRTRISYWLLAGALLSQTASAATSSSLAGPSSTPLSSTHAHALAITVTNTRVGLVGTGTTGLAAATVTVTGGSPTSTAVPVGYTVPRPFDSTLGTMFSSTNCPSFFQTFLVDPVFISCAPFSLLLTTSSAFFTAESSPNSLLPFILDATCSPSPSLCSAKMDSLALAIRGAGACGPDLLSGNLIVLQAVQGFANYNLMRDVGCLKSSTTQQYCFAEAASQSKASEIYSYGLAMGTPIPTGIIPTCSYCTSSLFTIYSKYATNTSLAISQTYTPAQESISKQCGNGFVPIVVVAAAKVARASLLSSSWGMGVVGMGMGIIIGW